MTPGEEKRKNETLKKTVGKTSGFSLREVVREWMNKTPPDENTRGKRREGKTNDVPENNKRRAPQQQMTFPETTNDVPENNKRRSQKQQTTFPETTNDVPENNKRRSQKQQTTCPKTTNDVPRNNKRRARKKGKTREETTQEKKPPRTSLAALELGVR